VCPPVACLTRRDVWLPQRSNDGKGFTRFLLPVFVALGFRLPRKNQLHADEAFHSCATRHFVCGIYKGESYVRSTRHTKEIFLLACIVFACLISLASGHLGLTAFNMQAMSDIGYYSTRLSRSDNGSEVGSRVPDVLCRQPRRQIHKHG
jgi:hypothetical protein